MNNANILRLSSKFLANEGQECLKFEKQSDVAADILPITFFRPIDSAVRVCLAEYIQVPVDEVRVGLQATTQGHSSQKSVRQK